MSKENAVAEVQEPKMVEVPALTAEDIRGMVHVVR